MGSGAVEVAAAVGYEENLFKEKENILKISIIQLKYT